MPAGNTKRQKNERLKTLIFVTDAPSQAALCRKTEETPTRFR